MPKKKQKKGFILNMMPGDDKAQRNIVALLTVILFVLAIMVMLDAKNNFYDQSKSEAFSERVSNTKAQ